MDSAAQFHTPGLTSLSMAFNLQAKSMSNLCIIVQHDFCGDVKHWGAVTLYDYDLQAHIFNQNDTSCFHPQLQAFLSSCFGGICARSYIFYDTSITDSLLGNNICRNQAIILFQIGNNMYYNPARFQMSGTWKVLFHAMLLQTLVPFFSHGLLSWPIN